MITMHRRTAFAGCLLAAGLMAGSIGIAPSAAADSWTSLTGSWDATMTYSHSRASCGASPFISIRMPQNDPWNTVRTDYLLRWNNYDFVYTGISDTATSNGALYFKNYNGSWLYAVSNLLQATSHGYYRVYETVSQNGRVVSAGTYQTYYVGAYASDAAWCTL